MLGRTALSGRRYTYGRRSEIDAATVFFPITVARGIWPIAAADFLGRNMFVVLERWLDWPARGLVIGTGGGLAYHDLLAMHKF